LFVAAAVEQPAPALSAASESESPWPSIRDALFAGRELKDGTSVIALDAPKRAQDAAVVPVTVKAQFLQTPERFIKTVHLIIDQNPAPVAAVFHFYPESGEATVETRVRVNEYTPMHAVAETSDGQLWVVDRFVKAAGGCSAPALKDKEVAMARLGKMKLKPMTPFAAGEPNRAQLLVGHPNYTGMQMDQLTRNWIPPDYVRAVKVRFGGTPVLDAETDISISEDPSFTFSFVPPAPGELQVSVEDSKGRRFEQSWPTGPGS
jgi:sulfur-oxidizing protein SoxY